MIETLTVNITKNTKWHVETICQYAGFPNPALTYKGASNLAHALWDTLNPRNFKDVPTIEITVNGKPISLAEAYGIIDARLTLSGMSYMLPAYRTFFIAALNKRKPLYNGEAVEIVGFDDGFIAKAAGQFFPIAEKELRYED